MTHDLLIDTDPGVDDALAILMALAHRDVRVSALTITAGNVGLHHTTANALKLLDVAGVTDVPVFRGAAEPLLHAEADAAFVHGKDGFGDIGYAPAPTHALREEHAALAMLRLSRERPGVLTFVMLGPLTNLALALKLDPTLPSRVKRLVIMGGAVNGRGNTRIPVEFNIGFDPEAAHIVFSAWPAFDLVDWEATMAHGFPFARFAQWTTGDDPRASFYAAISAKTRDFMRTTRHPDRWHAADALAMAVAIEPQHVRDWQQRHVAIELAGPLTRGMTVVDWQQRGGHAANARIAMAFPLDRFEALMAHALGAPLGG